MGRPLSRSFVPTSTVRHPCALAALIFFTLSSHSKHPAGLLTPAAAIAASNELGECLVSSLHVRVSTMPTHGKSAMPMRCKQRWACSRVLAVKTHVGTVRPARIVASFGSAAMSE